MSVLTNQRNLDYYGASGVRLEDPGEVTTDVYGVSSCRAVFRMMADRWMDAPAIGSPHPIWTGLVANKRTLKIDGPFCYAILECNGVLHDRTPRETPIYETVIGMSEDPIETHPRFTTHIGGTPMRPKNGAIFRDKDGNKVTAANPASSNNGYVFDSFEITSSKAKVESYLNPTRITFQKTWASTARPNYNHAGRIETPPGAPPLKRGQQWMNQGITSVRQGSIYRNTERWLASGLRGWDKDIYG